jgi:pyrrolidone-carboxylate peptidase
MKILVYGFGVYGNFADNITEKIIRSLPKLEDVDTKVFDVRFDRAMFETEFRRVKPDLIIGMGQHPRARKIRVERKAHDRRSEDGISGQPIDGTGDRMMSLMLPAHILATPAYDAGEYVCNFSMFTAESYAQQSGVKAAFLHIPRQLKVEVGVRYLTQLLKRLRASHVST